MEIDKEELLQRTYALAKENNKLLKKARHGTWIAVIFKLFFWAVMLGIPLWMYFTVFQPILQQGMATLNQVQGVVGQVPGVGSVAGQVGDLQGMLSNVPGLDLLKKLAP